MPESNQYGPLNKVFSDKNYINMTVEEYETIRLIDFEGFTQEECAERMQVARTTVQSIYKEARFKVSKSLVNGCILKIEGGNYKLYNDTEKKHCCIRCKKNKCGNVFLEKES